MRNTQGQLPSAPYPQQPQGRANPWGGGCREKLPCSCAHEEFEGTECSLEEESPECGGDVRIRGSPLREQGHRPADWN